jgi:hypothetical protein
VFGLSENPTEIPHGHFAIMHASSSILIHDTAVVICRPSAEIMPVLSEYNIHDYILKIDQGAQRQKIKVTHVKLQYFLTITTHEASCQICLFSLEMVKTAKRRRKIDEFCFVMINTIWILVLFC